MKTNRLAATLVAVLTLVSVAACGGAAEPTSQPEASSSAPAAQFPVTIEHAFGETTIESQPERVATVAWANHEVPLALGVVPVGMSKATWGDDDGDGVLPWVEDKLDRAGRRDPGAVRRDRRHRLRGRRRHQARRDPGVVLRPDPGGVRHAEQDRPRGRLPRGRLGDLDAGDDQDEQPGARAGRARASSSIADLDQQIAEAVAEHPELEGKSVDVRLHRPERPEPDRLLHDPRHPARVPRGGRHGDARGGGGRSARSDGVLRHDQRRGRRPARRRRHLRHLRRR